MKNYSKFQRNRKNPWLNHEQVFLTEICRRSLILQLSIQSYSATSSKAAFEDMTEALKPVTEMLTFFTHFYLPHYENLNSKTPPELPSTFPIEKFSISKT